MKSGCTTLPPAVRRNLHALSEQSYRDRVKYAAEKVRLSGTKIVMLTGPSASGKTTSAHMHRRARCSRQGTYGAGGQPG